MDLKRVIPTYSARRGVFAVVEVPPLQFLMIDGHGDPNTAAEYHDAVSTLYPMAFTLKALGRRVHGTNHRVMPLEALWWADDPSAFTTRRDKSRWSWTAMILVPDEVTAQDVDEARRLVATRGSAPAVGKVRFDRLDEGTCVQTLHVGPYDAEGPVLAQMHEEFIPANGLSPTGPHHEIYLGDPRRAAPERLRTILRQPVRRTG
ncbi:hypothetical protein LX14_002869 [Williamsia deligens]|nr:hypothetical protein [Williamsia deligens]